MSKPFLHSLHSTMSNSFSNIMKTAAGILVFLVVPAEDIRAEASQKLKIITLGDSITKGVRKGVTKDQTFATLLRRTLLSEGIQAEVINVGIGGERTDQALKRLSKEVINLKPGIVTIMYGTNDSYVDRGKSKSRISLRAFENNLNKIVLHLRKHNIEPMLMTAPRWGDKAAKNGLGEHPNLRLEKYVSVCRHVARKNKVPLVDHFRYWTEQSRQKVDVGQWTTDQCHPNPRGHQIIFKTILPVLLKVIQEKTGEGNLTPFVPLSGRLRIESLNEFLIPLFLQRPIDGAGAKVRHVLVPV